jgi:hypothetical protein
VGKNGLFCFKVKNPAKTKASSNMEDNKPMTSAETATTDAEEIEFEEEQEQEVELALPVELRRPTAKGKAFVRPNCSTTFWLNCPVCCRRYFKQDTHFECFARWCEICQDAFATPSSLAAHCLSYHGKFFCVECNNAYANIKGHRASEHPESSEHEAARKGPSSRRGKMAKTDSL